MTTRDNRQPRRRRFLDAIAISFGSRHSVGRKNYILSGVRPFKLAPMCRQPMAPNTHSLYTYYILVYYPTYPMNGIIQTAQSQPADPILRLGKCLSYPSSSHYDGSTIHVCNCFPQSGPGPAWPRLPVSTVTVSQKRAHTHTNRKTHLHRPKQRNKSNIPAAGTEHSAAQPNRDWVVPL